MSNQRNIAARHEKARTFVFGAIRALGSVAPGLAARLALRVFSSPQRVRNDYAQSILFTAQPSTVAYRGRKLAVWRWLPASPISPAGEGRGPRVLLVHGWSSAASHFHRWVPALTAAGYEVVAFDGPAHGWSEGEQTNLVEFAGAVARVAAAAGPLHGIVAHSMGGAAAVVAMAEGVEAARLVLLATPDNVEARIARFAGWLGLSARATAAMAALLAERAGRPLESVRLDRLAPRIGAPALVVHDEGDREVPWLEGARTAAALPGGRLRTVRGLGHTRVLTDAGVIAEATAFLGAMLETEVAPELRDEHLAAFVERFVA